MVTGFLLGDDVIAQRDSMIAKAEASRVSALVRSSRVVSPATSAWTAGGAAAPNVP